MPSTLVVLMFFVLLGSDFVHSACWIQGFYIYTEMVNKLDESGYYGIPKDINMDGLTEDGRLCSTKTLATSKLIRN